jgi:predicted DNA-binding transcriptional regulator YafY
MANTSSRTLRLLSLLQTHRYWPGTELAERLEISVRTLRRDIDRLRELGYPVQANRGVDGGYQLAAGAVLPPLLLDDEEAVALAVGLHAAAQGGVAGVAESSVRALTKVVQVMPPRLRRRVEALSAMTESAGWKTVDLVETAVLTAIAQACRDTERLRFTYTARDGARTTRHVEPHRLVLLGRRWYLVAYDLDRHDWRSFRLYRVTGPAATAARFRTRDLPAADAAAFVRAGIDNLQPQYSVQALVDAPAATVRRQIGRWATVSEINDERCTVLMTADTLDWPTMALGMVGAEFTVLSPPELAGHLRDWADRFSRGAAPR